MSAGWQEVDADRERVLICKKGPAQVMDQALMWSDRNARIETVATLAEAIQICMNETVDRLLINMFSFTAAELTSLLIFRQMKPAQKVVALCGDEVAPMLIASGLADTVYPIGPVTVAKEPPLRARA